jgi:L-alanine-DL-glutamate epimerase-like enolase superfamily enzyme
MLTRRQLLKAMGGASTGALLPRLALGQSAASPAVPHYEKPLFDLPGKIPGPVRIESIELLRKGNLYFVRVRSTDGATGVVNTKNIAQFIPIFERLVAPRFIGRDARDLEALVDEVYVANYKLAGQSLYCPLAYIDQSLLDMLGRIAGKPVGALLGSVVRTEIPVYLSGSARELSAEEEVDLYVRGVEATGARAVKFKIGGRMSRNRDTYPGRTETLIKLAREKLGDEMILYADANGSYNAEKAIQIGRMLEEQGFLFFEEPCPWEELTETQAVTKALKVAVAAGEQDSSLWRFQWMIDNKVMDIVQPDLNYHGGFIRELRVARMAAERGMLITPHNTQTGPASVNILQFASCVPNAGPFMEYPWRKPQQTASWYTPNFIIKKGVLKVPTTPGLGVDFDPSWLAEAEVVSKIT